MPGLLAGQERLELLATDCGPPTGWPDPIGGICTPSRRGPIDLRVSPLPNAPLPGRGRQPRDSTPRSERSMSWTQIEAEAQALLRAGGVSFPLPAYSEFMPAPWIGLKPCDPVRAHASATHGASDDRSLDITEYEQAHDLGPGLPMLAERILHELARLLRGKPHALSQALLHDNPAWPAALAEAAAAGRFAEDEIVTLLPLALSRTQDDKGTQRWTFFGHSHLGPAAAFWRSYQGDDQGGDEARFRGLVAWCGEELTGLLVDGDGLGEDLALPTFARP